MNDEGNHFMWTYPLEDKGWNVVEMPLNAKIIDVVMHDGCPALCVLVSELEPKGYRHFGVLDTGRKFDATVCRYVGSVGIKGAPSGGILDVVLHVFEWDKLLKEQAARQRAREKANEPRADVGADVRGEGLRGDAVGGD